MKRRLLFLERLLYGDGHTPFNGVFALKIRGRLEAGNFSGALVKLRAKHPLLRSAIEKDPAGVPYFIERAETPGIALRVVERRTDEHWMAESRREWATPFDTRRGPLLRAVWLKDAEESDLILAFHHCMCDGGSALTLMRELLLLLDAPDADIGASETLTTLEEILPEPRRYPREKGRAMGISILMRMALSVGAFFTPVREKALIPRGEDYLLHWKLDKNTSDTLFRYCKLAGVTVHTMLCVAVLNAYQAVRGEKAHGKVTCPVNIRRYYPVIKKEMLFAFGLAVTLSLGRRWGMGKKNGVGKKGVMDFRETVLETHEVLLRKLGKLNAAEFLLMLEYSRPSLGAMIKLLTYGKPGNDLMFSNMGAIDIPERYASFHVDTVYSPTIIGPFGNPTTLVTTTFKGQMDFCLVSNRVNLPDAEARAIRDKVMTLLLENMQVPPDMPLLWEDSKITI
jgi:Condensation domain